jgi:hypothetical protein
MRATRAKRIQLVPLDLATDLPSIAFGSAKVGRLTADELRTLVDESRVERLYPGQAFDAERFSEFHWLVVEEAIPKIDPVDGISGVGTKVPRSS